MKESKLRLALAAALFLAVVAAAPEPCDHELDDKNCDQTEYEAYKACVESNSSLRRKRDTLPCLKTITAEKLKTIKESCVKQNHQCKFQCNEDEQCISNCPVCPTNINEVSEQDVLSGYKTVVIEGANGTERYDSRIDAGQNVTTVIKLTNLINNTNTINVPTNVNTSNVNHVHVYPNNGTSEDYGLGTTEKGSCCYIVRPKSCTASTNGRRCHYNRRKTCGPQCTSRNVHVQQRRRCHSTGCQKRHAYIPQPRSRCFHVDHWPYVSCPGETYHRSCHGCYDHYGYGFENYYGDEQPQCTGCYDDGFEIGPMYRRGPVLRRFYYHEPPCYITGSCYDSEESDCGYGCFGHDELDPAFGTERRRHHSRPEVEYVDEDDVSIEESDIIKPTLNSNDTESNDGNKFALVNCKVLSENGEDFKNCTEADVEKNQYATAPLVTDGEEVELYDDDVTQRRRRHALHSDRSVRHNGHARSPVVQGDYEEIEENDFNYVQPRRRHRVMRYEIDEDDDEYEEEILVPRRRIHRHRLARTPHHQRRIHKRRPKIVYDDEKDY